VEVNKLNPESAIYSVLVQIRVNDVDAKTQQFLRIGLAFAVSKHHLATSGSVAMVIQQFKKEFPVVQIHSAVNNTVFEVNQTTLLPAFKNAVQNATAAGVKADELREIIESGKNKEKPLGQNALDKLIVRMIEQREKQYLAIEEQVFYDVGLLEVKEELPAFFPLVEKPPIHNSGIQIIGVAFPIDHSTFFVDQPIPPEKMQGHLIRILQPDHKDNLKLVRYQVECQGSHLTHDWRGSPVLTAEQQVIGVYSRPTPAAKPNASVPDNRGDVPTVERIQELLNIVQSPGQF